eukprot:sb/3477755/
MSEFMKQAVSLALEGIKSRGGGPFGCVIVRDGQIVGEGYNQVTEATDPTAHAEVMAIRDACTKLSKCDQKLIAYSSESMKKQLTAFLVPTFVLERYARKTGYKGGH